MIILGRSFNYDERSIVCVFLGIENEATIRIERGSFTQGPDGRTQDIQRTSGGGGQFPGQRKTGEAPFYFPEGAIEGGGGGARKKIYH